MPLGPDPSRAGAVLARLDALRAVATDAEDDVLSCLVVTGEPRPQRVLDDWLDQVADTVRTLGGRAAELAAATSRYALPAPDAAAAGPPVVVDGGFPDPVAPLHTLHPLGRRDDGGRS